MMNRIARTLRTVIAAMMLIGLMAMSAFTDNAVAKVGDTTYATLAEAIQAASSGDTVEVLQDITVDASITVDKGITLDLGGHTVTAGANVSGQVLEVTTTEDATVKNGTFEGAAVTSARAIHVRGDSAERTFTLDGVTVKNFKNSGGVHVYYGNLTVNNCTFDGNQSSNRGGGLYINLGEKVTVKNSTFTNNQAESLGGGLAIRNLKQSATISGSTIDGNIVTSNAYGRIYGGGFCIVNPGDAEYVLDGNTITNNTVRTTNNGLAIGGGVGLTSTNGGDTASITFRNNIITNNIAESTESSGTGQGGGVGIYIGDISATNSSMSEVIFESGTIANNKADWGGGIGNIIKRSGNVYLRNALITDNEAIRGGGLWACPTSQTTIYSSYSGAIYNNTALEGPLSNGKTGSGDDIRYESPEDSDILDILKITSIDSFSTVSSRALGGGLMNWYADDVDNRYQAGAETVDVEVDYTNRTTSFGLHGELDEEGQALAERSATLRIYDNTATTFGGGIATNSPVIFGEDTESKVTVLKKWHDENDQEVSDYSEVPTSVKITLIRIDDSGNEEELETITLSEENDWTHTFENMPTNYEYRVEEAVPSGYEVTYSTLGESDNDHGGKDYSLLVVNRPKEETPSDEEDEEEEEPDNEEEEEEETPDEESSVDTGDDSEVVMWASILFAGMLALAAVSMTARKRDEGKHSRK